MDRDRSCITTLLPLYGNAYILRISIPRQIQFHFHNANRLENVSFIVATRLIRAIKERRPEFAGKKNAKRPLAALIRQNLFVWTPAMAADGKNKNPLTSTAGRRFVSSQLETPCAHSTASKGNRGRSHFVFFTFLRLLRRCNSRAK